MLADLGERFQDAVQAFWDARDRQQQKQIDAGKIDAGTLNFRQFAAAIDAHARGFINARL